MKKKTTYLERRRIRAARRKRLNREPLAHPELEGLPFETRVRFAWRAMYDGWKLLDGLEERLAALELGGVGDEDRNRL